MRIVSKNRKYLAIILSVIICFIFKVDKIHAASPSDAFVTRIYETCLGREPDSLGLSYWSSQLVTKKITAAELVRRFIDSDEFKNKNLNNNQYVEVLYVSILGRASDPSGQAWWLQNLNNGYTRLRVLSDFINAPEFTMLCNSYGIDRGSITLTDPLDRRPDLIQFVSRLYTIFYNRQPDSGGLTYYVTTLDSKKLTAAQFIESFIFTPEFINSEVNYTDYINMLYQGIYGRQADQSGMAWWLEQLNNGYSRRYVLANFVASNEFQVLSSTYGLPKGQIITNNGDILKPMIGIDSPTTDFVMNNDLDISGWAINPSGIKEVRIYVDNTYVGNATLGGARPDINTAHPGYPGGSTSGYQFTLGFDSIAIGPHTLKVQAIGNITNTDIYQSVTFKKGNAYFNYINYNISYDDFINKEMSMTPALQVKNTSGSYEWRYAQIKDGQLGYYILIPKLNADGTIVKDANGNIIYIQDWHYSPDQYTAIKQEMINKTLPNLLVNDITQVYQFIKLSYSDVATAADLNAMFDLNGVLAGKGQTFIDAGKKYNVNPLYLAAHSILETNNGKSALATGIQVNGVTVYNLFGIGAYDSNPNLGGSQTAYNYKWFSIDDAIMGGANWISSGYIAAGQDTLFKMRWNPANPGTHQYATDVRWAYNQTFDYKACFDLFKDKILLFDIPVFK